MNQIDTNDLDFIKAKGYNPIGWIPSAFDEVTGKINPHVTKMCLGGNNFISIFHSKPVYYETRSGNWRPLGEITKKHGNACIELNATWREAHPRFIEWLIQRQRLFGAELLLPTPFGSISSKYQDLARPTLNIGLATTVVYPVPAATVDGAVGSNNASYDTAHDASSGNTADYTSVYLGANVGIGMYPGEYLDRGFFLFDTSSLGTDTVDSATVNIADYGNTLTNNIDNSDNVYYIVESTPASDTTLVTGDFDQVGDTVDTPTRHSDAINGTALSTGTAGTPVYNTFTLNATGEAHINNTGISKFGIRHGFDEGTDPGGSPDNRWLPASSGRYRNYRS